MIKQLITFFFLVATTSICVGQDNRQVYHSVDLKDSGVLYLKDILKLTSSWFVESTDDLTFQYSYNATGGFGGSNFSVYLNDTPMNINVWEVQNLEKIPIDIDQIDSVIIINEPISDFGTSSTGSLRIYSKIPKHGIKLSANVVSGNRSGDPGPYGLDSLRRSPNIDRFGPILSASIGFGRPNFYFTLSGKHFQNHISDNIQRARINPLIYNENIWKHPIIDSNSLMFESGYTGRKFFNRFQLAKTNLQDFLFNPIYGTEVPTIHDWYLASYSGAVSFTNYFSATYNMAWSRNNLNSLRNKDDNQIFWNQSSLNSNVSLNYKKNTFSNTLRLDAKRWELDKSTEFDNLIELISLSNGVNIKPSPRFNLGSQLQYTMGRNGGSWKTSLDLKYKHNNHSFRVSSYYIERLPEEDNSLWFWIANRGYDMQSFRFSDFDQLKDVIKTLRLDVFWDFTIGSYISMSLGQRIIDHKNEYLPEFRLNDRGSLRSISTELFTLHTNVRAFEVQYPIFIRINLPEEYKLEFDYTYRNRINRNNDIDSGIWDVIPKHNIIGRFSWHPVKTFSMWSLFRYQSSLEWLALENLDGRELRGMFIDTRVLYTKRLSNHPQFDFGIQKSILDSKLDISFQLKNIFNSMQRVHPIGHTNSFSIFFSLKFNWD